VKKTSAHKFRLPASQREHILGTTSPRLLAQTKSTLVPMMRKRSSLLFFAVTIATRLRGVSSGIVVDGIFDTLHEGQESRDDLKRKGLRGADRTLKGSKVRRRADSARYECDSDNPCEGNEGRYFPHVNDNYFVQCGIMGACWEMPCPFPGLVWSQLQQTCVDPSELINVDGNGEGMGLGFEYCTESGTVPGTKPTYDQDAEPWIGNDDTNAVLEYIENHAASCIKNSECQSCCCGYWVGGFIKVCTEVTEGNHQAYANVCLGV